MPQILIFYRSVNNILTTHLQPVALFAIRLSVAKVFLDSGLLKWQGWFHFNPNTYDLFLYEFFCPEQPRPGALLLCDPDQMEYPQGATIISLIKFLAFSAGCLEVLLPVLLIIGLLSRFAALGLLGMTLFIQLAVFPTWSHWVNPASWWAICLLMILARGPGGISVDKLLKIDR